VETLWIVFEEFVREPAPVAEPLRAHLGSARRFVCGRDVFPDFAAFFDGEPGACSAAPRLHHRTLDHLDPRLAIVCREFLDGKLRRLDGRIEIADRRCRGERGQGGVRYGASRSATDGAEDRGRSGGQEKAGDEAPLSSDPIHDSLGVQSMCRIEKIYSK